jgi:hypothetical protein
MIYWVEVFEIKIKHKRKIRIRLIFRWVYIGYCEYHLQIFYNFQCGKPFFKVTFEIYSPQLNSTSQLW